MLLFSKIYEFYCLYGIEILLSGATGAARQNSYEGLHIFSYEELFTTFYHFLDRCITFSNFLPLFLNSSYEAVIYILLTGICIITGHIGLNKHLHRINRSDTSNCPNCTDTEETVAHYISQCPAYSRIRGDTLGTYYDSINNIMDNNNIDLIINFALKTKRLLKKEEKDDTGVT